jgi:hypothetical protein
VFSGVAMLKFMHFAINLLIIFLFLSFSADIFYASSIANLAGAVKIFFTISLFFGVDFLFFKFSRYKNLHSIYASWALIFLVFSIFGMLQFDVAKQSTICLILLSLFCAGILKKKS